MDQLDNRIKTLQCIYKYSDFSIFCAEVTHMFRFMMPLWETVEFKQDMWYYAAIFHIKRREQLKFVICNEGFTKHQFFYRKRFTQWKQLFDTKDYQGANCMNNLHDILIYYQIHLKNWQKRSLLSE